MIPLRATALIDAPEAAVRRALCRTDVWTRTVRALGARAEVAGGAGDPRSVLRGGELIRIRRDRVRGRSGPGQRSLMLRVSRDPGELLPRLELLAGPLRQCAITLTTAPTGAGTYVTADFRVQASPSLLTPMLRGRVLTAAQLLLGITTLAAQEQQVVVAGAIVRDGRVLAARRTAPAELAGRWELPGGKVRPGETDEAALARELAEELGLTVLVGERVGADVDLGDNTVLRCFRAGSNGLPVPTEHDQIRWLAAAELTSVPWLDSDRQILHELSLLLTRKSS